MVSAEQGECASGVNARADRAVINLATSQIHRFEKSMKPRSLAHRAPLLGLVVAWGTGSALTHTGTVTAGATFWACMALTCLALAWIGRKQRILCAIGIGFALTCAGALRTDQRQQRLAAWDELGLPPREARLVLRIERLFAPPEADEARISGLAEIVRSEPHLADLAGQRIQFSTTWRSDSGKALRGVEFTALGLLEPVPRHPPAGSFTRYLADSGVNFSLRRARLLDTPTEAGPWTRFCDVAGMRLEKILRHGLQDNERAANLYVAMLLGRKQELSVEQTDWFIRSGTMHLFAISGLHIAGIAVALQTLLTLARVHKFAGFIAGTALLWIYVDITGGAPSAVRAFWMVTCLWASRQFRTPGNSLAALATSALGILIVDPHQLFSASFQMSYGIVAALLFYGVPLQEKWLEAWKPWASLPKISWTWRQHTTEGLGRSILGLVALGLAATLISTPATLGFFGLLAPGGFFVNLVLIPASTLVLFAGVAALLTGLLGLTPLTLIFNHAAALVLVAMESVVGWSLKLPVTSWPAAFTIPTLASLATVLMLSMLAAGYIRGWRNRDGGYWAPYAALGLMLVLGVKAVSVATP
ncbi:MAG: ComEC/Rec2 family competence protein [Burkholderiales bacterium]|nr:ComEC/Rec2 family competence protein [Opitutaceae bacterium]